MSPSELASITEQASGMAACMMRWAGQPEIWPAFASWAEQRTPGESWDENDRHAVVVFGLFLEAFAKELRDKLDREQDS